LLLRVSIPEETVGRITGPVGTKEAVYAWSWTCASPSGTDTYSGVLAYAIDSVSTQREASHVLVNAAYTSQIDSTTGLLEGKRVGERFYRVNGDVMQADHNAALNVLARIDDPEIERFTPFAKVKAILLARSPGATERQGLESVARPSSAEKSYAQVRAAI